MSPHDKSSLFVTNSPAFFWSKITPIIKAFLVVNSEGLSPLCCALYHTTKGCQGRPAIYTQQSQGLDCLLFCVVMRSQRGGIKRPPAACPHRTALKPPAVRSMASYIPEGIFTLPAPCCAPAALLCRFNAACYPAFTFSRKEYTLRSCCA